MWISSKTVQVKSLVVPADFPGFTVVAAAASTAKTKKKAASIAADDSGGKDFIPAETGTDVLAIISRLIDRPFLCSNASGKLKHLEKMLMPGAVQSVPDANRLLGSLGAALLEAEGALDDIEYQHLCPQGLIMAYQDDKNLVRKLLLDVRCSRMKNRMEKRMKNVESVISKAHRQVRQRLSVSNVPVRLG